MEQENRSAWNKAREWLWNALWYWADVIESAWQWVIKWATWLASWVWEWAAFLTDVALWTNLWSKEWFLDKLDKSANENLKQWWALDLVKSKWWETEAWKVWLWVADTVWQFITPYSWALKWLKLAKWARDTFLKVPKAKKELEALIKSWKKIEQSQVDDILKKYSWNVTNQVTTDMSLIADKTAKQKRLYNKIKKFTPEQIEKLPMSLKKKLWITVTWWVVWLWLIWNEASKLKSEDNTWIELVNDNIDNNLTDEDIKTIENIDSNKNGWPSWKKDYRWREIIEEDWLVYFKSIDWSIKWPFKNMGEANSEIDKWIKWYEDFKLSLEKIINNINLKPEQKVLGVIKSLWLKEDFLLEDLFNSFKNKWFNEEQFKKIVNEIQNPSHTLSL